MGNRLRAYLLGVLAIALVYQLAVPHLPGHWGDGLCDGSIALGAAYAGWGFSRHIRLSRGRSKGALIAGCGSTVAWCLANALFLAGMWISPLMSWGGVLSIVSAVLLLAALSLLAPAATGLELLRLVIDVAAVSGALVAVAWVFVLDPAWNTPAGHGTTLTAGAATWLTVPEVLAAALAVVTVSRSQSRRRSFSLRLLAVAALVLAATALLSLRDTNQGHPWYAGGVGAGYLLSTGLLMLSGRLDPPRAEPARTRGIDAGAWAALPYVPIILAVAATAVRQIHSGSLGAVLVWVLLGTFALVLLRQFLSLATVTGLVHSLEIQQKELAHQADHDALTGLANRAAFARRTVAALAAPTGDCMVLLVDLDGFKPVNDRLGHAAGDDVLITVARRLLAAVRPGDVVARLGGDEFVVLLRDVSPDEGSQLTARLLADISRPVHTHGVAVTVGASIGVTTAAPGTTDGVEALLRQADAAMYAAKADGKGKVSVHPSRTG